MITEDYVSFETAKLLKEKGFDEYCWHYYNILLGEPEFGDTGGRPYNNTELLSKEYTAPTIQMAMKWLETEYRFLLEIYHSTESGSLRFSWRIYQLQPDKCHYVEELKSVGDYYVDGKDCNSREECCDSAIKYCLENLI